MSLLKKKNRRENYRQKICKSKLNPRETITQKGMSHCNKSKTKPFFWDTLLVWFKNRSRSINRRRGFGLKHRKLITTTNIFETCRRCRKLFAVDLNFNVGYFLLNCVSSLVISHLNAPFLSSAKAQSLYSSTRIRPPLFSRGIEQRDLFL